MYQSGETGTKMSQKVLLRKEMKRILKCLSEDEIKNQSAVVTQKLLSLPAYQNAERISIFLSMSDEIDTSSILQHALREKQCFIPQYFKEGSRMKMVKLKDLQDYEDLPMTSWNIKQPADDDIRPEALETGGLDLILVPGLAFTLSGLRCGRGRGYYDTYLQKASKTQTQPVKTVALAFKQQILDHVPTDSHDFVIDHVLSA